MYISLGLLWVGFKIIHGEIIPCPIGGLTDKNLCDNLNKGVVCSLHYFTHCIADKLYAQKIALYSPKYQRKLKPNAIPITEPESSSSCSVRSKLFSNLCDELDVHPLAEQILATTTDETTQKYQY